MAEQKKLVEIVWDEERKTMKRKDNNKKVTAKPIGPLFTCGVTAGYTVLPKIKNKAEKYTKEKRIGYEFVLTATDIHGTEFYMGDDTYAFKLYKIT